MARTLDALARVRELAERDQLPPPLVDSPKCPRCSLVGLCLPDETNLLAARSGRPPRRLMAAEQAAQPLYATTPGARLSKRGERVVLKEKGEEVASRRLLDVAHIAAFGNVDVGSALLRECFDRGVPVLWLTAGGWLSGVALGMPAGNVSVRMRHHRAAAVGGGELPALFVAGKLRNQRTMLRRHGGVEARETISCASWSGRSRSTLSRPSACWGSRERPRGCTSGSSAASCEAPSQTRIRSEDGRVVRRVIQSTH